MISRPGHPWIPNQKGIRANLCPPSAYSALDLGLQPARARAGAKGGGWYDLWVMNPDRATALLAVVRIISVLGMALAISSGIFMLLGGWILPALAALAAFLPFFFVMRFMEKRAVRGHTEP